MTALETDSLHALLLAVLDHVHDPEFGISVRDMGLIHQLALDASGAVRVAVMLTSPHCPAGDVILNSIRDALSAVEGVSSVEVGLVWDPPWTPDRLSAAALERLG